jgi:competence protein ComFC
MIDRLLTQFLRLIYPEQCAGCKKPGTALCTECLSRIPPSDIIYSVYEQQSPAFALYDYADPIVQKAIWELKYYRKSPTAQALAEAGAARALKRIPQNMKIIFVPIPQHYTKTFTRGFNQSALIAKWFSRSIPNSSIQPVLKKVRATEAQAHSHNRAERQKNLADSITAKNGTIDPTTADNALYIVVDDVITTGSTANEASRALRAAGASNIFIVALAHGYAKR